MQSVSASFENYTQFKQRSNFATKVEVLWHDEWVDESSNVVSWKANQRISAQSDELVPAGQIGDATVVLHNKDKRYSWERGDSALAAYINKTTNPAGLSGKLIRISQGWTISGTPEYARRFTGVIYTWAESDTQVTLECRDMGYYYLQHKISTPIWQDKTVDAWIEIMNEETGIADDNLVLDAGLFPIDYVWCDDESFVEQVWQAASADGGNAYFDCYGRLVYQNALHWANQGAVDWTFTEGDYSDATHLPDADSLATEVIVEWSGRTEAERQSLYTLNKLLVIGPKETKTFEARFDQPATNIIDPVPNIDYIARSIGGVDMSNSVSVILTNVYAQKATVQIYNSSEQATVRINYLTIRGNPIFGAPQEQAKVLVDPSPFDDGHVRTRSVRGNVYIQTEDQANMLASFLSGRCKKIQTQHRLSNVPGVPHLELGDFVNYVNTDLFEDNDSTIHGFVIGISEESGEQGYWQSIDLLDPKGLYEFDDFYIIGTTALGEHGRLWY